MEDQELELFWQSTIPVEAWSQPADNTIANPRAESSPPARTLPRLTAEGFDQFQVHGVLGRGGMGVVHHAHQGGLQRSVAYKKLHKESSEAYAQILIREALVTGALNHPSIVPVHVLGLDEDDRPAFVMQELDGVQWKQVIEFPDVHRDLFEDLEPLEFHIRVLMRVATAVQFAHERGVLHRDIKPENVSLGRYDEVYLLDWGLAAALDSRMIDRVPLVEDCTEVLGSPAYLAPEMASPLNRSIGVFSDVYLLGATLFHVLTGKPPHSAENLALVLFSTQSKAPPELPDTVPSGLAAICHRALAYASEDRYQSADEFRRDLRRFLVRRSSMHLSRRASDDLERLIQWESERLDEREPGESTRAGQVAVEARFGFEQALGIWDENPRAQVGLKGVLSYGVRGHIRNRDLSAAESLFKQIESPDVVLVESLDRLRAELLEERAERQKMARDLSEFDPGVRAQSRALASSLVPFAWAGLLFLLYFLDRRGTPLSWELWLGQAVAAIALAAPVTFVGRRVFLGTKLNRRLSGGLYIALLGDLAIRVACSFIGLEPLDSVPAVMGAQGIALGMLGLQIDPRMIPGSFIYFGGVVAAGLWPEHGLLVFACTVILALGPMALIWRQSPDLLEDPTGSPPTS